MAVKLNERLSRLEKTIDHRMQTLLTPRDELEARGLRVKRLLDYLGLPGSEDGGMADRCKTDRRVAQVMLSTGLEKHEALIKVYAEQNEITEDQAREWMQLLGKVGRAVEKDISDGVLPERSARAPELRKLLTASWPAPLPSRRIAL